jgi:hypothetical protein
MFYTAQGIMRERARRYTDEELIERLRSYTRNTAYLSGLIINETEDMPSSAVYAHRFQSLIRAYQMVGYTPDRDYRYLEVNHLLRQLHPKIVAEAEAEIAKIGGHVIRDPATDLLHVNDEFSVSLVLARCHTYDSGSLRWKIRFDTSLRPDITVAIRLDHENQGPLGLLPAAPARLWPGANSSGRAKRHRVRQLSLRNPRLSIRHGRTNANTEGRMTPQTSQ